MRVWVGVGLVLGLVGCGGVEDNDGAMDEPGCCADAGALDTDVGGSAPRVLEGSYVVRNALDLRELNTFAHVTGDVRVEANGMNTVVLEQERIDGALVCLHVDSLKALRAERLTALGGAVVDFNPRLVTLEFPVLERVTGSLEVEGNPVEALRLDRLESIGEALFIDENTQLTQLSMDALGVVGERFVVSDNAMLDGGVVEDLLAQLEGVDGLLSTDGNQPCER